MMKALLNRLNGLSKDRDKDLTPTKDKDTPAAREKVPQLPPLPDWPPSRESTASIAIPLSLKPLPELVPTPPPHQQAKPVEPRSPTSAQPFSPSTRTTNRTSTSETIVASQTEQDSPQNTRKTTNGNEGTLVGSEANKKVAFIQSPPATPHTDRPSADGNGNGTPSTQGPAKTTLSRFQATYGKDARGSTIVSPASSKTDPGAVKSGAKTTSTRNLISPVPSKASDALSFHQTSRSNTPFSQLSNQSARVLAAASWSEGAEEDLVCNLGPRERTRQEVLWEIVASEERYVGELLKLKDSFIDPLLHPFSTVHSTPYQDYDEYFRLGSPVESIEQLPIAARFMSPLGFRPETPTSPLPPSMKRDGKETPVIDVESMDTDEDDEDDGRYGKGSKGQSASAKEAEKHNHPRSPYRSTAQKFSKSVPFPSRSHHSLPPPPRGNPAASTKSLERQSTMYERDRKHSQEPPDRQVTPTPSRILRKFKKSTTTPENLTVAGAVAPHLLPEDLRICLEALESGIVEGHQKLSEGLRKRYDDQYPLVRSLADVFVANSQLFHGYATFVLHLERALGQVDNALSAEVDKKPKKQDAAEYIKVCKYLKQLEDNATARDETGLAISLSKPFQRLLKYPLLFQNLLFHTDPSTYEYESTLQMVAQVESIVRSIEDEKIQKEERDKTRDVFARIEGLEKHKQLVVPKPTRVLVEERLYAVPGSHAKSSTPPSAMAVKGKTSFRRLSDVLHSGTGIGGRKDLWLVVFNDVILQCQRTGQTSLPLVSAATTNGRTTSLPEMQGKAKYATTGRRNVHTKPRNLYKFIKIENWSIGDVAQPREGVVSMEDMVRSRAQVHSGIQPKIEPLPDDDDGASSDHSDTKSKMSFSYWGADKITIQNPSAKSIQRVVHGRGRRTSPHMASYGRESSANAKFGTRLVSSDNPLINGARSNSRRNQPTPTGRRAPPSDDTHSVKATVTRPAWDSNTRSTQIPKPRPRLSSQTGTAPRPTTTLTTTSAKQLSSPALSDDSGVGLYRQIIAQDPSITEARSKS